MAAAEITFLYGESVPRCAHRIDKVFQGYSTLQYMSAGAVELSVDGRAQVLQDRWFWSAWPGPRIAFGAARPTKTWRHRYVAFRGRRVRRWTEAGLFPIAPQPAPGDREFGERFDRLLDFSIRRGGEPFAALRAIHVLEELLIELAEARCASRAQPAWLKTAIERLGAAARGQAEVDYQQLADALGMAEVTFRRRFREATGASPHDYVLHTRVAEARRLLGETNDPIKSIAARLRYRDVYFFSRQFKQFAGVPPALFRRSRQG